MTKKSVLIVGAGPTGMALALTLKKHGITPRIIDQHSGPGQASRAMVVHARTLELYRQLGFGDEMALQGVAVEEAHVFASGHEVASLNFKNVGGNLSPYPYVLAYAQDDHERFLAQRLAGLGLEIEWNKPLKNFTHDDGGVQAQIGDENARFDYICGCDGARSRVRETLGLGFPGGTYSQMFFVADVKIASGFEKNFYINFGAEDFGLMLPVRVSGMQRLIGVIPSELMAKENVTFEDLREAYEKLLRIKVTELNWFSTYHTHHRVAEHFRVGRCFLLGDAGHIHSPMGGQGMNTGIGDAINLGWKLAEVLKGNASAKILQTYEEERLAFAKVLVATTDRMFRAVSGRDLLGRFVRLFAAPNLLKLVWAREGVRRFLFKAVSQIQIRYRESLLSQGRVGELKGGDRMPWVEAVDNFEPLKNPEWQLHVHGRFSEDLATLCARLNLPKSEFTWSEEAAAKGLTRSAAYLLRPDSYIALILPDQKTETLLAYVERFGLKFASHDLASKSRERAAESSLRT